MNATEFIEVCKRYKKCPNCGSSWKDTDLKVDLIEEVVKIYCACGFEKYVDKNNKEIEK